MGEVYRARDTRLGREVALKVLPEPLAHDPDRLKRFEREAKATAALSHPNVLTVFDVGSENGRAFVVTELLEGTTLAARLRRGPLPVHEALAVAAQAARGLAAAHARGIVHRDLKPDNLFLTTSATVKILDFGLARLQAQDDARTQETTESNATGPGAVLGTVSYMSPEQARGLSVDARSDLFSLGVVLHEMLAGRHPFRRTSSAETVSAILRDPPPDLGALAGKVPATVERLARRCLEKRPEDRFQTASDLALALDLLAQGEDADRPSGVAVVADSATSEERPYPGLASFTEADTAHFFGREDEVRALWEKIRRQKLLAVIGPSGVGKTSFLRAGVLAHRPTGWSAVYCTPGTSPVASLARALSADLVGDADAVQDLLAGVQELTSSRPIDAMVSAVARWRRRHAQALLVLDQAEELFTLAHRDAREAFSALLGRLVEALDLHVLIGLRDDFLFRCTELPALGLVFDGLSPLTPPSSLALWRALVEPAARLSVRFEDDALAQEMVATVANERGALPLLAFTAARLWDERDRDRKLLTRETYEWVGGVGGALAQHAEATLQRIGPSREAVVRRMFREVVTAEATRASRSSGELLSVFGDEGNPSRREAADVLDALVGARLLTEYDAPSSPGSAPGSDRRVEIVHESLLTHWPRLGRWLAQDAEGALLRDQLRQAARLWNEKGRPEELLWTGRTYREFALWRERHSGGLSDEEESFAWEMAALAGRRRRRWRLTVTAIVASLATGLAVVAVLWGRSEAARQKAEAAVLRAEASKLLALGQVEIDRYPTAAVAYALKSLELSDSEEARLFALRALQRGPTAILAPVPADDADAQAAFWPAFSPDGEWLAVGGLRKVQLLHRDGGPARVIGDSPAVGFSAFQPDFGSRNDRLFASKASGDARLWSIPDGRELWRADVGRLGLSRASGDGFFFLRPVDGPHAVIRFRAFGEKEPRPVATVPAGRVAIAAGERMAHVVGRRRIYTGSLRDGSVSERVVGTHSIDLEELALDPQGRLLVARDTAGQILVWRTGEQRERPYRVISGQGTMKLSLGPRGRWLAGGQDENGRRVPRLWDLAAPPDVEPLLLRRSDATLLIGAAFDPSGSWLASGTSGDTALWRLGDGHPQILTEHRGPVDSVVFTPDGEQLISASRDGTVRSWPLSAESTSKGRVVLETAVNFPWIAIDPTGRHVAVNVAGGRVLVVALAGGPAREVTGFSDKAILFGPTFSDDGRLLAFAPFNSPSREKVVRVWDRETGATRVLGPIGGAGEGTEGGIGKISFIGRDTLVAPVFRKGLVLFNLRDGTSRFLSAQPDLSCAVSPRRRLVFCNRSTPEDWLAPLIRLDLDRGSVKILGAHGRHVYAVSVDPTERLVATGSTDGTVRVGSIGGAQPHVFFGHASLVRSVAFSPDGHWLASSGEDRTIRLWRIPAAGTTPFHLLPREVLLARLRGFTNLRAVPDPSASGGYRLEPAPFPGWATAPDS